METTDLSGLPADLLEAAADLAEDSGLLAVADAALDRTGDTGIAAEIVGSVVDSLIDFERLEIGPLGEWLEAHDGPAAEWLADVVISVAMDPRRRALRQIRREARRDEREARRTERRARRALRRV
jgi:hypothetical protein